MKRREKTFGRQQEQGEENSTTTAIFDPTSSDNTECHQQTILCYKLAIQKVKYRIDAKLHVLLRIQSIQARNMIREGAGSYAQNNEGCSYISENPKEEKSGRDQVSKITSEDVTPNFSICKSTFPDQTSKISSSSEDVTPDFSISSKTTFPSTYPNAKEREDIHEYSSLLLGLRSSSTVTTSRQVAESATENHDTNGDDEKNRKTSSREKEHASSNWSGTITDTSDASSFRQMHPLLIPPESTDHLLHSILQDQKHLNELHLFAKQLESPQQTNHSNLHPNIQPHLRLYESNERLLNVTKAFPPKDNHSGRPPELSNISTAGLSQISTTSNPNKMMNTNTSANNFSDHRLVHQLQLHSPSCRPNLDINPFFSTISNRVNDQSFNASHSSPIENRDETTKIAIDSNARTGINTIEGDHIHSSFGGNLLTNLPVSCTQRIDDAGGGGTNKRKQDSSYLRILGPISEDILEQQKRETDRPSKKRKTEEDNGDKEDTSRISNSQRNFLQTSDNTLKSTLMNTIMAGKPETSAIHSSIRRRHDQPLSGGTNNFYPYRSSIWPVGSPSLNNSMYDGLFHLQSCGIYSQHNAAMRGQTILHTASASHDEQGQSDLVMSLLKGGEERLQNSSSSIQNSSSVYDNHAKVAQQKEEKTKQGITAVTSLTRDHLNEPGQEEGEGKIPPPMEMRRVGGGTGRFFLPLGIEQDRSRLSEFLTFLRSECIEVFTATNVNVLERMSSKKVAVHQAGIRCVFCAHLPPKRKAGRSSHFPSSIARLYQGVSMMIYKHFSCCIEMPANMRLTFDALRKQTKKGDSESRSYWIESAKRRGLVDCGKDKGGIRLVYNPNSHRETGKQQTPSNKTFEEGKENKDT